MAQQKNKLLKAVTPYIPYVLLSVTAYFLFKKFFKGGTTKDVPKLAVDKSNLSKEEFYLKNIAENQYNAMNEWGTNLTLLFSGLDTLNADDLKQIYNDFGKRCSNVSVFPGTYQCITEYRDLLQWYVSELSGGDLTKMKGIWTKTGIF